MKSVGSKANVSAVEKRASPNSAWPSSGKFTFNKYFHATGI